MTGEIVGAEAASPVFGDHTRQQMNVTRRSNVRHGTGTAETVSRRGGACSTESSRLKIKIQGRTWERATPDSVKGQWNRDEERGSNAKLSRV